MPKSVPTGGGPNTALIKGLDPQQQQNANIIVQVGKQMHMSDRDIAIAIMTAMDESTLHNLHGGDRDSEGLFQQRPSQGWGTPAQVTDPQYAAKKFYEALRGVHNRNNMNPWMAAQTVQVSGTPDGSNYERFWNRASNGFQVSALQIASYFTNSNIPVGNTFGHSDPVYTPSPLVDWIDGSNEAAIQSGVASKVFSGITSWEDAVKAIGAFFGFLEWIFNVDHFLKMLLYVFGAVLIAVGLGMVTMGGNEGGVMDSAMSAAKFAA